MLLLTIGLCCLVVLLCVIGNMVVDIRSKVDRLTAHMERQRSKLDRS
jgi:hypothetical protein